MSEVATAPTRRAHRHCHRSAVVGGDHGGVLHCWQGSQPSVRLPDWSATEAWPPIAGFGCLGIGLAVVIPMVFNAAGRLPGLNPGAGIATVSACGWLKVELHDPDDVVLGVLEPGGRHAADIRDALDGLQPREVVLLEDDAT